jgi:hypothetical protein
VGRLLLIVAALGASGCGGFDHDGRGDSTVKLSTLAGSGGKPGYYAGDAVAGLPLVHVDGDPPGPTTFVYGECNGEGGGDNFICRGPQIQIQNWTLAERDPSRFRLTPSQPAACARTSMRGVPVAKFETTGGGLEVYTGEAVVVVFAPRDLARRAIAALRPLRGSTGLDSDLPQPPPDVIDALRRCALDPPDAKLRELEEIARVPLYWVGPAFEGHPLARVEGDDDHARFVYGACVRSEDYDSGTGCWAPLEIAITPVTERHPAHYSDAISCGWREERNGLLITIPGAHTFHVFTGRQTVALIGQDLALVRRAVAALRTLDRTTPARQPLPRPPAQIFNAAASRCSPDEDN